MNTETRTRHIVSTPTHTRTHTRTGTMITRRGTQVGDCEEMRLRSGHRVGVTGPAAKVPTSAAEARAMLMRDGMGRTRSTLVPQ